MSSPLAVRGPLAVVSCLIVSSGNLMFCQESALTNPPPSPAAPFPGKTRKNVPMPCYEPAPLPGIEEYDGPFRKTVGIFARALERKSVHEPHYKPGTILCSLELSGKFQLFVDDSIDPVNFLDAGFNAGIDHATNRDPSFGQGAKGYATRFGADLADNVSSKFFKDFAYPAIFSEDPRYYRLGEGSSGKRLAHAVEHLFVAHRENGTRTFNYSEWLGSVSAAALGNLYHPGNEHGTGDTARRIGYSFAFDIGYDVLREFWPEITHKLKLPFRSDPQPTSPLILEDHN